MIPQSVRKPAAWATLAVAFVGGFEGLRQAAYKDPVGIPTICFGETKGVKLGDYKSVDECKAMLEGRLEEFNSGVAACTTRPMTDNQQVAFTSFAYNVGVQTYCKSSIARNFNAGNLQAACDSLLLYNRAGGMVLPGLTRRRTEERELCLK